MSIEKKLFGNSGHRSTRTIFGGAALGGVSQEEADRTLEVLLEYGVNHLDVAASYGNGEAEKRMGPWLVEHRKRFFLATKTGQRRYEEAREEFHSSLERLRVDSVDLIQLHNLIDPTEWQQALGPGGALEALIEARDPEVFLITAGDIHILPRVLEAASQPKSRPTDNEMEQMLQSREMQTIFQGTEFIW